MHCGLAWFNGLMMLAMPPPPRELLGLLNEFWSYLKMIWPLYLEFLDLTLFAWILEVVFDCATKLVEHLIYGKWVETWAASGLALSSAACWFAAIWFFLAVSSLSGIRGKMLCCAGLAAFLWDYFIGVSLCTLLITSLIKLSSLILYSLLWPLWETAGSLRAVRLSFAGSPVAPCPSLILTQSAWFCVGIYRWCFWD